MVTPEREAAVLNFVQRNHAELADLLAVLKTSQPDEYVRALREIFRATGADEPNPRTRPAPIRAGSRRLDGPIARSAARRQAQNERVGSSSSSNFATVSKLKMPPRSPSSSTSAKKPATAWPSSTPTSPASKSGQDSVIDQQMNLLTRSGENRPAKLLPKTNVKAKASKPKKQ